jgi:urocanate hydratase
MLRTLEASGFVRRRGDGNYEAGSEIIRLGALHSTESALQRVAQPYLDELETRTGESCYLAVPLDDLWATYVRMAPSTRDVRHVSWLGRRLPREGSAVGAALAGRLGASGAAIVRAGVEADTVAVAVPIRSDGVITAAINVVGPSFRIDAAAELEIANAALQCAAAIEQGQ